jgi:uncharacterized protein (TIGR02001 family)
MKLSFKLTLSAILTAAVLGSSAAYAGASANVGLTSNYMWRGVTQTNDQIGFSAGLDYDFGNGLSVGTWAGSLASGTEVDLYGAYGGKAGPMDYSVGFIHYAYPVANDLDFTEVNASLGYGPVTFSLASTVAADDSTAEGDLYYSLGLSQEVTPGITVGALVGQITDDSNSAGDYTHGQISLGKGDFTAAIDDVSGSSSPVVSLSWSHAFDL